MNEEKHAYIFGDEEKAKRFYNAVDHGGIHARRVGNAVLTAERVFAWVIETYQVAEEDHPIWMSDYY